MSANLTEQEFSKHVTTEFQAKLDQQVVPLKLAEVKTYRPQENEQSGMERFSAYFEGPGHIRLPQGIYSLSHAGMGEFELFLVPISGDESGFRYEAVFNYYRE